MTARIVMKRISLASVLMFVFVGLSVTNASAHVTVKPGEVPTASYQTFTVNVPNEKEIPTTQVRVVVPAGVTSVTPTQKSGWVTETKKDGDMVTEITWKDGEVGEGLRDEFTFSAKTPADAGKIEWKAYQTYSDGTVVAWDQAETEGSHAHEDENKGPLSVTSVVTEAKTDVANSEEVANANSKADRAMYIAVAAVVIALIAVFFATRKNRA